MFQRIYSYSITNIAKIIKCTAITLQLSDTSYLLSIYKNTCLDYFNYLSFLETYTSFVICLHTHPLPIFLWVVYSQFDQLHFQLPLAVHSACCYLNFMIICTVVAAVGRDYKLRAGSLTSCLAGSSSVLAVQLLWLLQLQLQLQLRLRLHLRLRLRTRTQFRENHYQAHLIGRKRSSHIQQHWPRRSSKPAALQAWVRPSCPAIQMISAPCPTCPPTLAALAPPVELQFSSSSPFAVAY